MNPKELHVEHARNFFSLHRRTLDETLVAKLLDNHIRDPVRADSARVRIHPYADALWLNIGTKFLGKARARLTNHGNEFYLRIHTGTDQNTIPLIGAVSQLALRQNFPLTIYFGAKTTPFDIMPEAFPEFTPTARGEYRLSRQND